MVFSSTVFLFLFLPLVLATYAVTPRAARNGLLLFASLIFYAWGEGAYVLLMLASTGMNYGFGLAIGRARDRADERAAKRVVTWSIVVNIGLLVAFKYANFLCDNVDVLLASMGAPTIELPKVHLPIGISFFTFHALSYVLDVYRNDAPVQRKPADIALYIALFPQLVAGPIVRYRDVDKQIESRGVTVDGFAYGVSRFVTGLAKKVLIANVLAEQADKIFDGPAGQLTAGSAWLGTLCYTLQIYFDFSGYSDMAIGLARMFAFRFRENFAFPYVSQSITEFWRRWHISLSTWFRDYLYIPLGGNRKGPLFTYRNLFVVFFLCGLWHGASWNFVIWGLLHGAFLVVERVGLGKTLSALPPVLRPLRHAYTLFVVMIGWVFFRAETLPGALAMLGAMFGFAAPGPEAVPVGQLVSRELLVVCVVAAIGSTPIVPAIARWFEERRAAGRHGLLDALEGAVTNVALVLLLLLCAANLSGDTYNPFIYFRF